MTRPYKKETEDRYQREFASSWRKSVGGRNNRRRRVPSSQKREAVRQPKAPEREPAPMATRVAATAVEFLLLVFLGVSIWSFRSVGGHAAPFQTEGTRSSRSVQTLAGRPVSMPDKDPAGWGQVPLEGALTADGKQRYRNLGYDEEEDVDWEENDWEEDSELEESSPEKDDLDIDKEVPPSAQAIEALGE